MLIIMTMILIMLVIMIRIVLMITILIGTLRGIVIRYMWLGAGRPQG